MKTAILLGLLLGALHGTAAEAHTGKNRMKFQCDADGCTVTAVKVKHHHHGHKEKIKFAGNVCRYRPWNNVTVCKI